MLLLIALVANVYSSHITHVSPLVSTVCHACSGSNTICESNRASAPMIDLQFPGGCLDSPCKNWGNVIPRTVEDVDSAFAWDTNYTLVTFIVIFDCISKLLEKYCCRVWGQQLCRWILSFWLIVSMYRWTTVGQLQALV